MMHTKSRFSKSAVQALLLAAAVGTLGAAMAQPVAELHDKTSNVITLQGVFRDFRAHNLPNGHPDFGTNPDQGRGLYCNVMGPDLNADGDPVPVSTGYKVTAQARNSHGQPIMGPKDYMPSQPGDSAAVMSNTQGGSIDSLASGGQLFRDVMNINSSDAFPVRIIHDGQYWTVDCDLRTQFASVPAFGGNKVYGYTYELESTFMFDEARNDIIRVGAADAMWVYVNGKLVADLGGDHDFVEQIIEMNRIEGLVDGQSCSLKVFYHERTKIDSRFLLQTSVTLRAVGVPPTNTPYD